LQLDKSPVVKENVGLAVLPEVFVVFFSLSRQILEQPFEIGHGYFHIRLSVDVHVYVEYIFFVASSAKLCKFFKFSFGFI